MRTVLVDDEVMANVSMIVELSKLGDDDAVAFTTKEECIEFHSSVTESVALHYVVDLDLGEGRRTAGVTLVKELREARRPNQTILISALSSHTDLRERAIRAGADSFIAKTRTVSDAREVRLKELNHVLDEREEEARAIERQLARDQYAEFAQRLEMARAGKISVESVQDSIRKLLAYRYLDEPATDALSALDQWLSECAPSELAPRDYRFFVRALRLLKKGDDLGLRKWLQSAHERNADVILPWLAGEADDDAPEENDWPDEDDAVDQR